MKEKHKLSFECVRPIEEHARLVMEWRNDPVTLAMSYHTGEKLWDSFYSEFKETYFRFPDLPPLFVQVDGKRVAFLRFKPVVHPEGGNCSCSDISINVAPDFRQQGLGAATLTEVQSWLIQQGYNAVYAEVKLNNQASQKTFLKAGFHQLENGFKELIETGERIPIARFIALPTKQKNENKKLFQHVFIIAEAGSNWRMGTAKTDLLMGKMLIQAARDACADAIKFQVYRPETVYVENAGKSSYLAEAGIEEPINAIFSDLAMPYEMIEELSNECKKVGILFMATPFSQADFEAVDPFVTIHKIASYEIGHIRLLELAAKSGKPILLSTGAATEDEIAWSLDYLKKHHATQVTLLQCTASYPASPSAMNLKSIPWMSRRFNVPVGLSDHSAHPSHAPITATARGATVIEKHFTFDRRLPGPDHAFAINPQELKEMVQAIRETEAMLGSSVKMIDSSELPLRKFARRGVQAIKEIRLGDTLSETNNIAILRPGEMPLGAHPKCILEMEGKTAKRHIGLGEGVLIGDW